MTRYVAAASSDTGQIRAANEDSWHAGDSVFAVADGMGGHVAGEVASATALEPVAELDGRVFGDASGALEALREAVLTANTIVHGKSSSDPRFEGMGTTLTAAMIEHRRLHIAHVGDSRAYLFRNDRLVQLTHDHTLVQALVDEGQIDQGEAASHPQRSIITRAIGVDRNVAVDALTFELEPGDRVLLCSDGLTTVVTDPEIAGVLREASDVDEVVTTLIELANEEGGPDNITVVALDFDPERVDGDAAGGAATVAAGGIPVRVPTADDRTTTGSGDGDADWADRIGALGGLGTPRGAGYGAAGDSGGPSTAARIGAVLFAIALLAALVVGGGRWLIGRSYYVGLAGDQVAIYQGVPTDLGPLDLSWVHETTQLSSEDVPDFYRDRLMSGIPAADLADARRIIASAPRRGAGEEAPADAAATASPRPSPTATASAPATPDGGATTPGAATPAAGA